MASINRLTARQVATITRTGRHADGAGLYLVVKDGRKSWALLVTVRGKRRELGLGGVTPANGLKEAREAARLAKEAIQRGDDPTRQVSPTFREAAEIVIADLAPGWRGKKTEDGWRRNLLTHAKDIGGVPVDLITTDDVLGVVKEYWTTKPETGGKLRERIEVVLDASKARGWRKGDNPARWRGHLDLLLPKRRKLTRGHHRAIPHADAPAFMADLAQRKEASARALEWTIYSVVREDMTIQATGSEIVGDLWNLPGERMKGGKPFSIPITPPMKALLEARIDKSPDALLFPGAKGKPMSNATMDALLKRMKVAATPHGFRSTFRDWAGDETDHPREVAEAALAHVVGSSTERSYRRGDALRKRRLLMENWARFLTRPGQTNPEAASVPPDE